MELLVQQGGSFHQPKGTHFDASTGYLLVKLDMDSYGFKQQPVSWQGDVFQPKDELHITILSQGAAGHILEWIENESENDRQVRRLIEHTDWSYRKQSRFYHVREDAEESIVQMVDVAGLEPFFAKLGKLVGEGFPLPPTHVTLFVKNTEKGIGLPTQEVFERLLQAEVPPRELIPVSGSRSQA